MGSPNLFETLDSKGSVQDSATPGGPGFGSVGVPPTVTWASWLKSGRAKLRPKNPAEPGSAWTCQIPVPTPPHSLQEKTAGPTSCRFRFDLWPTYRG